MRLLVSVRNGVEAAAAVAGDADLIDAKEPSAGALGAVSYEKLIDIHQAVGRLRPITAALGDASTEASLEQMAHDFSAAGVLFAKVGFAGISNEGRVTALIKAAVRGARAGSEARCGVVSVAYADSDIAGTLPPSRLVKLAASAGATAVLIDTADKRGPGLCGLMDFRALEQWVSDAHAEGLLVAAAGRLTSDDLPFVRDAGADIAGVRGAACEGGRSGPVSRERVRHLRSGVFNRRHIVDSR